MVGGSAGFSTVQLTFYTNANQTANKIKNLDNKTKQLGNNVSGLATKFIGLQVAVRYAERAFAAAVETVKRSITEFREFELRMAEVGTILTDNQEQLERLTIAVEQLSIRFGQATSDMAKGLYDILSAAFDAREAIQLLDTATRASIAGLSTVRESVDIFTTVLNTYGMSVTEATRVSDILFQSVIRGKFQFKDLSAALQYVVPIAAQAGIQFDELMAALSTATRHGLRLDMTSRGLALAIQNIISPTEKAKKVAMEYGIDMSDVAIRVHGLTGFFTDLNAATKIYGKTIISELIPNMRSLRIAMVLAGDVGLAGFAEDLGLLEEASGRTNEALNEITSTSKFLENQLQQMTERQERMLGDYTDWIGFQWKKLEATFAAGLKNLVSLDTTQLMADLAMIWLPEMETSATGAAKGMDDFALSLKHVQAVQEAEKLSEQYTEGLLFGGMTSEQLKEIEGAIGVVNNKILATQDAFNRVTGPIYETNRQLQDLEITLVAVEKDIKRLNDELNKSISYGWGVYADSIEGTLNYELELLKAEQIHVDLIHDINMGLEDSTYIWKTYDAELEKAVGIVREVEKAQKSNRKETELTNIAMKQNNLEIMKLQLRGMMRRRGLTRGEERRIKKFRILNMQERISNEEKSEKIIQSDMKLYQSSKELIDKTIRDANEKVYQMKYTYNQQISDLDQYIIDEGILLDKRVVEWNTTWNDINTIAIEQSKRLGNIIASNPVLAQFIDAEGLKSSLTGWYSDIKKAASETAATFGMVATMPPSIEPPVYEIIPEWMRRDIRSRQRGGYIPRDMPIMAHRGETITPAGRQPTTISPVININIDANITSEMDLDNLARQIAYTTAAELEGKYELR